MKSNLKTVRKFIVLAAMLGCLFVVSFNKQAVKAQQCCTFCETLDQQCQQLCEFFPGLPCYNCNVHTVQCVQNCDPGC